MQIKNRQQTLLVGAILAVGLFAGDKLLLRPFLNVWDARSKRITALRTQIAEGQALLDRKDALSIRWAQWQRNTLTNNPSAAEQQFWQALDRWQQDSSVVINATTPQWKTDSDEYTSYQVRLDASGNLNSLTRFLFDIETEPMALKLESMELSARDKGGQQFALGLQVSALVLTPKSR